MKSRAQRRHHTARMEARARQVVRRCAIQDDRPSQHNLTVHARRMRDNLKRCSCTMCGNPRRHWQERTLQERRHAQDTED